jgi:hypothetical protein
MITTDATLIQELNPGDEVLIDETVWTVVEIIPRASDSWRQVKLQIIGLPRNPSDVDFITGGWGWMRAATLGIQ